MGLYHALDQFAALRLLIHVVKAEMPLQLVLGGKPQRQIAGRFIEIGTEAAVRQAGPFCADPGEGLNHQVLRILRVADHVILFL